MLGWTTKEERDLQCTLPSGKYASGQMSSVGNVSRHLVLAKSAFYWWKYVRRVVFEIFSKRICYNLLKNLNMDKDCIFQDDNDRKHWVAFVTNWLNREHIHCASNGTWHQSYWTSMGWKVERRMKKEFNRGFNSSMESNWEKGTWKKLLDLVPNRLNELLRIREYPRRYKLPWKKKVLKAKFVSFFFLIG